MNDRLTPAHGLMRRLAPTDVEKLACLFDRNNRSEITRYFHPFSLNRSSAEELLVSNRKDLFFGIEANGDLKAFSMLRSWDEGFDIPSFGVLVDFESLRQGHGRRLTEWTLRWAGYLGCSKVRLSVYAENEHAHDLYKKMGFTETDLEVQPTGLTKVIMERAPSRCSVPVYVSTQCLPADEPLEARLGRLYAAGLFHIELSNYPADDIPDFPGLAKSFPGRLMLHHFFPPERENLVLNLASPDESVFHKTLAFFKRGVDWSAACGAQFYSVHAGYVTDPVGKDAHGFTFPEPKPGHAAQALHRFTNGMIELSQYAQGRNITMLVENNVLAEHHKHRLLLSTPADFKQFLALWPNNLPIGILLDWGHWEVTASTMETSVISFKSLHSHVLGMHLHRNNGRADQHLPFDLGSLNVIGEGQFNPLFLTLEGRYPDLASLQAAILDLEGILR